MTLRVGRGLGVDGVRMPGHIYVTGRQSGAKHEYWLPGEEALAGTEQVARYPRRDEYFVRMGLLDRGPASPSNTLTRV